MSLDEILKAKQEGRNMPWKELPKEDFKRYYDRFHSGKSRNEVAKEDSAFYDAVSTRGFRDYVFPPSRRSLSFDLDLFAQEYVGTIIPVKELAEKYAIPKKKVNHVNRYLKKAVDYGIISEKDYEDAVERRQFLNLMGKYFSPEMQNRFYEIASRGYSYIQANQASLLKDIEKDFMRYKNMNGDSLKWPKTNRYYSKKYGKNTYAREVGDGCITNILSNGNMKELQNERRRLIYKCIQFFHLLKKIKQ